MNEREAKNYGLGGDLWDGYVEITMDKTLVKGEETRVVMKVVDCDGLVLKNKEISTAGTGGGIFTPAKFKTDNEGMAIVKFKMTTDKTAFVKASCETKNVWGCDDLYTGTEAVKGIEGAPVKVSINYEQDKTNTLKPIAPPGVDKKGGAIVEITEMQHRAVLYHFPTQKSLGEGFLVETVKDVYPQSRTEYVTESGWFFYTKSEKSAQNVVRVGGIEMVKGETVGEKIFYSGSASLQHTSEVTFYKGDKNNPAQFFWHVEYPADNGLASVGITIIKGEEGVTWKVNKITDPKSIYKTEYLLSLTLNAEEELKKEDKAMKELFGFKLNDLAGVLDPTKQQGNIASASGSQTITARILSPYPDK